MPMLRMVTVIPWREAVFSASFVIHCDFQKYIGVDQVYKYFSRGYNNDLHQTGSQQKQLIN